MIVNRLCRPAKIRVEAGSGLVPGEYATMLAVLGLRVLVLNWKEDERIFFEVGHSGDCGDPKLQRSFFSKKQSKAHDL